jgi:hypothetical protein
MPTTARFYRDRAVMFLTRANGTKDSKDRDHYIAMAVEYQNRARAIEDPEREAVARGDGERREGSA